MAPGKIGSSLRRIQASSRGGDGVSPYTLVERLRGHFRRRLFYSCFRERDREQARAAAISDGGHIVSGVPARGVAEIVAGAGVAAISSRCLSNGAYHFCGAGCGGDRMFGEIPAAWRKLVSNKRGAGIVQPDRAQDGCARRASP